MAENSSDSDSSITGWTVVNDHGECDTSDSGSTSSSLEFVQLEESGALYQRRTGVHGDGKTTPGAGPEPAQEETPEQTVAPPGAASLSSVKKPESLGPLETSQTHVSNPSVSPSPSPTENESDLHEGEEDVPFEPMTPDPENDPDQTPDSVPPTEKCPELCPQAGPSTASQDDKVKDTIEDEQNHQIELLHAALVRQESDSDSDFVQLDALTTEHGDRPPLSPEVSGQMETSASSGTSETSRASSSISANFRFVNLPVLQQLQPRREEEEEEEEEDSLSGDFDDRCESDISGVATDETDDSDLSSMIYSIDDIPLTAGRRLYRHRPNSNLNSILTIISLVTLFFAIGIAVGHYIGVSRDDWLRKMQVERMKGAQDNHLMCLRQADLLKGKIRKLTATQGEVTGSATPGGSNVVRNTGGAIVWKSDEAREEPVADREGVHQNLKPKESAPEPVKDQTQSAGKERMIEAELKKYVQSLRAQLNQVQMENVDLRAEVTRLRYTEHPANAHVSNDVTQRQLKVKVNQLASENDDLKSAVGKMRYTVHPGNSGEIIDETTVSEVDSTNVSAYIRDVAILEQKLENVSLELTAERKMNLYLQGIVVSSKKKAGTDQGTAESPTTEIPSSILSCVRQHLPDVVAMPTEYVSQAGQSTQEYWSMLNKVKQETTNQIVEKWHELIKLLKTTKMDDFKLPEELEKLVKMARKVEETITKGVADDSSIADGEAENKSSTAWRNISKPALAHFQDYVNKTTITVFKLSETLQETWQKVRNLSKDLLMNPEQTVQKVQEKIKEKVIVIGDQIKTKWDTVKEKIRPRAWKDQKRKSPHHHHPKYQHKKHYHAEDDTFRNERKDRGPHHHHHHHHHHHQQQQQQQQQQHHQKHHQERASQEPSFEDTPKQFEDKPHHKQRQSSHEQYNDFWKKNEYDPDDFFHEGFFEGNQREWRKHQKRLKHLHGRIHRLNEDILYSMDDDDIEDIYEDLDDLEDDLEDEDQPQTLQTWLACQVRWWKSRLHRKHRSENLIIGCGQQIMQWQLRALCKDRCVGKKCGKKKWNLKIHPLCQQALQSQDSSCHHRGQTTQCHNDIKHKEGFHSTPLSQNARDVKNNEDKFAKPVPQKPAGSPRMSTSPPPQRAKMPNEDYLFTMDSSKESSHLDDKVNNTAWESEDEDLTLSSQKLKAAPASLHSSADGVADQSSDADASWVFERAVLREYHHHNPDWVFERAAERDLERNKPWYVGRSEDRHYRRMKKQYDQEYRQP